jgi:AraC-like DNA-binding protein
MRSILYDTLRRVILGYLMRCWYAIFCLFLGNALSAQAFDLGKACRYRLEPHSTKVRQVLETPTHAWMRAKSSVIALGSGPEILWLDCELPLFEPQVTYALVSQYNFSRRIEAFAIAGGNQDVKAISLKPYAKSFWQRQEAFYLESGANSPTRVLIRYEADLVKTAYFQTMPEHEFVAQGRHEGGFFFIVASILSLFVLFNLMLAWSFRSVIPVLYSLTTIGYFVYQIVQFGFGPILFYPQHESFNGNVVSLTAGVAIPLFQGFFQKLLQLKQIAPRVNRAILVVHAAAVIYIIVTAFSWAPIGLLQKIGRLLFFAATTLVFWGGWIVYRRKFRPALYSIYGFVIMTLCQSLYFLVMAGFIDAGAYYVKALLPAGQFLEYLLFFTTLSMRLRDKGQINRLRDIAEQETVQREILQNAKLRLPEAKAAQVEEDLRSLFETEKIYCDEDLSLDRLANMINITRHELSDLLKKRFATNFYEFVNTYRIKEAKRLLIDEPGRNILDVALEVGFNSKSTFNKEFKRITGTTPREIRATSR